MRKWGTIAVLAVVLSVGPALPSLADDHLASSTKITYMGRTSPPQTSEVWIGEAKSYVREGSVATITRQDLGKKWIVNQRTKKYLEEPFPAGPAAPPKEEKFRIQEYGWNYHQPVYEWSVKETGETAVIDGRTCAKIVLTGEADYSSEIRELWIAKDVPIDLARYYGRIVEPNLEAALVPIYRAAPALKNGLAVKTVMTEGRPIAGSTVWETILITAEKADPPAGIYDLPAGFSLAKTREELAGR